MHDIVEAAFARERAAGRMTREEVDILQRRLDSLACTMTLAGIFGEVSKATGAAWMIQVQQRRIGPRPIDDEHLQVHWGPSIRKWPVFPAASARVLARAERWWSLAAGAGLLRVSEEGVAFPDDDTREYFCLHYLQTYPLDARLLRLAARPAFAPIWRRWAQEDPVLVDRLLALLREAAEPPVRTRAATVLGYLADPRARDPLLAARAGDSSKAVRIAAIGALAMYGDPDLIEQLAQEMTQQPEVLRPPLAVALGKAGEPSVPALVRLLPSRDWLLDRAAVIGLGYTRSPRAAAALLDLPEDRMASNNADHVVEALVRLGEVALPTLLEAYNDERRSVAKRARQALSRLGYVNAADALLALLRESCRREPGAHFPDLGRALIQQCSASNVSLFRAALADPHAEVRLYAAVALADRQDEAAFAPLMGLLHHANRQTRSMVAAALGRLGDRRAVEPLIAILEQAQAQKVPALPDPSDVKLGSDTRVRFATMMANITNDIDRHVLVEALGKLGDRRATPALLRELERADNLWRRGSIARALGNIGDPAAIEPLSALMDSLPGHYHDVITALALIVDQRALGTLRRLQARFAPDTYPGNQIARAIRQLSKQLGQQ